MGHEAIGLVPGNREVYPAIKGGGIARIRSFDGILRLYIDMLKGSHVILQFSIPTIRLACAFVSSDLAT